MSKRKERRMSQNEHAGAITDPVPAGSEATSTALAVGEAPAEETATEALATEQVPANFDPENVDEFPEDSAESVAGIPDEPLTAEQSAEVAKATSTVEASEAMAKIADLQEQIKVLKAKRAKGKVQSGSKPRVNAKYTLLKRPPKWEGAPQVDQLLNILFDPTVIESAQKNAEGHAVLSEPELFQLVKDGAAAGILRTRQEPVRIFQYYRSDLRKVDAIAWE